MDEILIDEPGDYRVSGHSSRGIVIDVEDQIVHLYLNGVELESSKGPAINIKSAGKAFITVETDTNNVIKDFVKVAESKNIYTFAVQLKAASR